MCSLQENAANPLDDPLHQEGSAIEALLQRPNGWCRNSPLAPFKTKPDYFYQDRLGTNIARKS